MATAADTAGRAAAATAQPDGAAAQSDGLAGACRPAPADPRLTRNCQPSESVHPRVRWDAIRLGLGSRAVRRRRHWTQEQLAEAAGVSRSVVWRIERGRADRVPVHTLDRIAAVLGGRVDVRLLWQGEALDRLLDAGHAELVEHALGLFVANDWHLATEVSFQIRENAVRSTSLPSIR